MKLNLNYTTKLGIKIQIKPNIRKQMKLRIMLIVAVVFITKQLIYTVPETEQVIITQFGKVKRTVPDAGLKFKLPVLEQINTFEKRLLEWDGNPTQVPTQDKRYIWVDSFARWRIEDP